MSESINQSAPSRTEPLSSGYWGSVERLYFEDGATSVRKTCSSGHAGLAIEGRMLEMLSERSKIPVPRVLYCDDRQLLLEDVHGAHRLDESAERHAAHLLAELHAVLSPDGRFGLEFDTLIGPLPQPNGWYEIWPAFFRDRRLLPMAGRARDTGELPGAVYSRVEAVARRIGELVPERPPASLVHGDVWSGNVLASAGRVTAFLDPSISYSHAEVELAFISLFSTFGPTFFELYGERHPIASEFWTVRKDVYNLYPLLVHVCLFGASYLEQLDAALRRLKF